MGDSELNLLKLERLALIASDISSLFVISFLAMLTFFAVYFRKGRSLTVFGIDIKMSQFKYVVFIASLITIFLSISFARQYDLVRSKFDATVIEAYVSAKGGYFFSDWHYRSLAEWADMFPSSPTAYAAPALLLFISLALAMSIRGLNKSKPPTRSEKVQVILVPFAIAALLLFVRQLTQVDLSPLFGVFYH